MKCNIPSNLVGACDLEYGHEGRMHANSGDGFYAKDYDLEHANRQLSRSSRTIDCVAEHMQAANKRGHV